MMSEGKEKLQCGASEWSATILGFVFFLFYKELCNISNQLKSDGFTPIIGDYDVEGVADT